MRLLLAYRTLDAPAGSESYLVLLAEQLTSLGHEATIWTPDPGGMAEVAERRGVTVRSLESELPADVDGMVAQDGETAHRLRLRYPEVPLLHVVHSTGNVAQAPPRLDGVADAVVTLNDRSLAWVEAGPPTEVVRLRQPVDRERFRWGKPSGALDRVVVFGHHLARTRFDAVRAACDAVGAEIGFVGGTRPSFDPAEEIARADAVVGVGRCAIEAMAAGKAAYVLGNDGGDGWVTPASYAALEADGFAGRATGRSLDARAVAADFGGWSPAMGEANRDLVARHHDATDHAVALVAELRARRHAPDVAPTGFEEVARLVRVAAALQERALSMELRLQRTGADATAAVERAAGEIAAARAEAAESASRLERLRATRRYRLAGALSAPLDRLRSLRSRR